MRCFFSFSYTESGLTESFLHRFCYCLWGVCISLIDVWDKLALFLNCGCFLLTSMRHLFVWMLVHVRPPMNCWMQHFGHDSTSVLIIYFGCISLFYVSQILKGRGNEIRPRNPKNPKTSYLTPFYPRYRNE